ncbi:MAG TPA: serine hydrolase domain-containing protein [Rhodopila sp.]|uniref:serine hydrolase domain-containing protein n=1 Tax=Rhodopila sp. TaxID=2480087 RepID=UPI002BD0DC4C|nr:serine hydrolase domain-containing protein [Rhodopila sp.]HVY17923.1 serine hydrolase domain-containing protein [Rhodopila sp.]
MRNTAQIDKVLAAAVAGGHIAGLTAAAADRDGEIYAAAFGLRRIDAPQRMTTDTVFRIASMTKAVTGAAAMQMVEQGKLSLDQPAKEVLPFLAETQVLDGFDGAGQPVLRAPKGEITLRNLLTHTAGFVYDTWNADMNRYAQASGLPAARTGQLAALKAPLGFDPGARWEYGINIDIAGRMVEVASGLDLETYFQRNIFAPLGMTDTSFDPRPAWDSRLATVHARLADGTLKPLDMPAAAAPREFYPGGGGLFSTSPDYLKFLQALMNGGELAGNRILKPETVALMGQNHMGALNVLPMKSAIAHLSNDVELFPGMAKKWGLTFLINTEQGPHGRAAGSLAWAGLNNTYYWLDPEKKVAGVIMTQVLPFADATVLEALDAFEGAVYGTLA